jgi:hypothetical protein
MLEEERDFEKGTSGSPANGAFIRPVPLERYRTI